MMIEMLKAELRKVWMYYAIFLIVIVGYVLLLGRPLSRIDYIVAIIAIGQGWVLAWRIFSDPGATRSFLFSRPLSRRRLFFTRWALGLTLQALTIVVLFAVIAFGLRSWLQVKGYSLYHPMVRWFELEVLWPVGLFSLLAYELQMFLKLRAEILAHRPNRWVDTLVQGIVGALTALLLLVLFIQSSEIRLNPAGTFGLLVYVVTVTILATAASAHCYRHLEVDA